MNKQWEDLDSAAMAWSQTRARPEAQKLIRAAVAYREHVEQARAAVGSSDFTIPMGRDRGKRISEVSDLGWLKNVLEENLKDPDRQKFKEKNQAMLNSLNAELARRNGR